MTMKDLINLIKINKGKYVVLVGCDMKSNMELSMFSDVVIVVIEVSDRAKKIILPQGRSLEGGRKEVR